MTLYGVGMGPGDPSLVTVRGRELVETAETIFAPGRLAESLASPYASSVERLEFPMTEDEVALEAAWEEAAATVAPVARDDTAAFVTVGDPRIYSTFSYLDDALGDYPTVDVETVPGVSVVTAFTTALGVRIDSQGLAVREARSGVPDHDPDQLLLLKVTDVPSIHDRLTARGYEVTYGRRLFMDEPTITTDPTELADSDYFTIAFAQMEATR